MPKKLTNLTNREILINYLLANGSKEVEGRSHYRQFTRLPEAVKEARGKEGFYFIGKNGAMRVGICASKSISIEAFAKKILEKEKERLKNEQMLLDLKAFERKFGPIETVDN